MKAGILEPEETHIARQRIGEKDSATKDTQAAIEEFLGTIFSASSV
jgi:hypothetical protein